MLQRPLGSSLRSSCAASFILSTTLNELCCGVLSIHQQDKSLEKTNVKIDWNKFVDEDEEEGGGEILPSTRFRGCCGSSNIVPFC